MLGKISMAIDTKETISFQKSSLFHGALMGCIEPEYAASLHKNGLKPFSQHIQSRDDKVIWTVNAFSLEACEKLIKPLQQRSITHILINHNNMDLHISEKNACYTNYQDLVNTWYFGEHSRYVLLKFCTPTAFKSSEKYVFYPDPGLILKSLINKYDSFSTSGTIWTEEVFEQLVQNIQIRNYRLRSIPFHLEGTRIPAFMGSIGIYLQGPQPLVNLVHLLLHFGEYSGVGIKTSLGMGALQIQEGREKSDRQRNTVGDRCFTA